MDKWAVMHSYRRHAANGEVPAILCPDDDQECVPMMGEDGEPVLRCIDCDSRFAIGSFVYDQMIQNLKEIDV